MIASKLTDVKVRDKNYLVAIPADPEGSMNADWERYGESDKYFPFWLEPWPSSYGLFDYIQQNKIDMSNALEIGCGCGVFAQLAVHIDGQIIHTDLVPSACAFAQKEVAIRQNELELKQDRYFLAMDMQKPVFATNPRVIVAADIFYEYPLIELFAELVRQTDAIAYVADPGRESRPLVAQKIENTGLKSEKIIWEYTLNGEIRKSMVWKLQNKVFL